MTSKLTRREILANSAALGVVFGTGYVTSMPPAMASALNSNSTDCKTLHPRLSQGLSELAFNPQTTSEQFNHAVKTAHCPSCNTQITSDSARNIAA